MATATPQLLGSDSGQTDTQMTDTIVNGLHESSSEKSPRFGNLGFLKAITERKTTRDGHTPKRRGPKPDSKPALTRRQELNRQAQRTHRERKEVYLRTVEEELVRTKMAFNESLQDARYLAAENRELKALLTAHGIPYTSTARHPSIGHASLTNGSNSSPTASNGRLTADSRENSVTNATSTYAGSSLASTSGTRVDTTGLSPLPTPGSNTSLPTMFDQKRKRTKSEVSRSPYTVHHQASMDHDQLGVDFVLALEAVCHDHAQMMCVRSDQSDTLASGHAMMMSCPPPDHVRDHPDVKYPSHKAAFPNLPAAQLMRLYDTSLKLPSLGGEITPIQALQLIRAHPRYGELTEKDYDWLRGNLVGKSRCYGFGAVLEEFEVHDALLGLFQEKYQNFKFQE